MKTIFYVLPLIVALNVATPCQTAPVPIVEMKSSYVLGGVQNGKWIAREQVAPKMQDSTEFVLVGLNGVEEGGVTIGKKNQDGRRCSRG